MIKIQNQINYNTKTHLVPGPWATFFFFLCCFFRLLDPGLEESVGSGAASDCVGVLGESAPSRPLSRSRLWSSNSEEARRLRPTRSWFLKHSRLAVKNSTYQPPVISHQTHGLRHVKSLVQQISDGKSVEVHQYYLC